MSAKPPMVTITTSVEHNVDLPPDRFAVPDKIQALVDEEAAEEAASDEEG